MEFCLIHRPETTWSGLIWSRGSSGLTWKRDPPDTEDFTTFLPSRKWEQEEPTADMVSQTNSWLWSRSRFWPWCFRYLARSLVWHGLLVLVLLLFLIFVLVQVQVTGPLTSNVVLVFVLVLFLAIFPGRSLCPGPCSVGGGLKLVIVQIFAPVLFLDQSSSGLGPGPGSCPRLRLKRLTLCWQSEPPVGSSVAENSWLDQSTFPPVSAPRSHCVAATGSREGQICLRTAWIRSTTLPTAERRRWSVGSVISERVDYCSVGPWEDTS